MARGRMTKREYRCRSARTGHGTRSKPNYMRPRTQSGYHTQKTIEPQSLISLSKARSKKPSKLIVLTRGA